MSDENKDIAKRFHETRREDHEDTIEDLAGSIPNAGDVSSREVHLDLADIAFGKLHDEGKIEGPFELPSERAKRLQREADEENRPETISTYSLSGDISFLSEDERKQRMQQKEDAADPDKALAELPIGTVAIRETVRDLDPVSPSLTINWLRCQDASEAESYLEQAGVSRYVPSYGGEEDGIFTKREIFTKAEQPSQAQ
jgi:hypothetical protein